MASNFRIELVREEDMVRCMEIVIPSFSHMEIEKIITGPNTPENRKVTANRHLHAIREHQEKYPSVPVAIKCVHTDPSTGDETIVGFLEWFVFDRERSEEEYKEPVYFFSASWVEDDEQREYAQRWLQPVTDARIRNLAGRPYGLLVYMAVDEAWRRQGVASLCIRWGMEQCAKLGIPTYLEASEQGYPTYSKLGWEKLEDVDCGGGVTFPAMMWWPPGTKAESDS